MGGNRLGFLMAPYVLAIAMVTALPQTLVAQADSVRIETLLNLMLGTPLAGFADRVDAAVGLDAGLRIGRPSERVALRVGVSAMLYGHESITTCVTTQLGCRVSVGVTTTNQIWAAEAGPEIRAGMGSASFRAHLAAGASLMLTNTGLSGDYDLVPLLSKREGADGGFVWGGGVGISAPLRFWRRASPALEVDASYRQHGLRRYLIEGGVRETTTGVNRDFQRSNVSLLQWRIGLSFQPDSKRGRE